MYKLIISIFMFMFLTSSIFAEDKVTSWNDILKANEAQKTGLLIMAL